MRQSRECDGLWVALRELYRRHRAQSLGYWSACHARARVVVCLPACPFPLPRTRAWSRSKRFWTTAKWLSAWRPRPQRRLRCLKGARQGKEKGRRWRETQGVGQQERDTQGLGQQWRETQGLGLRGRDNQVLGQQGRETWRLGQLDKLLGYRRAARGQARNSLQTLWQHGCQEQQRRRGVQGLAAVGCRTQGPGLQGQRKAQQFVEQRGSQGHLSHTASQRFVGSILSNGKADPTFIAPGERSPGAWIVPCCCCCGMIT